MSNFLPHRFTNGGYQVMVNADRSILVKQGDSLSKYSMAIYGNFKNIDRFFRKEDGWLKKVVDENKDLIITGESLYHPDPLPKEPPKEDDGTQPPLQALYVSDFFRWIKREFRPTTEWAVDANGMANFAASFFREGGSGTIGIKRVVPWLPPTVQPVTNWYHALCDGSLYDRDKVMDGLFSPIWFGNPGCLLQPFRSWGGGTAGSSFPDFSGSAVVIEAGPNIASFTDGRSVTAVMFGRWLSNFTLEDALDRIFRQGQRGTLEAMFLNTPGAGVALVAGRSRNLPGIGLAAACAVINEAGEHP